MKFFAANLPEGLDTSPWGEYWYKPFDVGTATGYTMSSDKALHVSAFFAGVRLISETVGMVPLFIYERLGGSAKRKALNHPLHDLLHDNPNPWQTALQWKQMMTAHAILRGNGYSKIQDGPRGPIDRLIPLDPTRMKPEFDGNDLVYKYRLKDGEELNYPQEEIFHLAGFGDGVVGLSVVDYARETLGLALGTQEHGARFFGQGACPSGLAKHPGQLSENARKNIKKGLKERIGGVAKHHDIMVLEEGMDWVQLGISNEASQFLESRKFEVTEIARWLGLPPHVLGDLEKATFSNIEQQAQELVVFHLMSWWVRWEQTTKRDLIMAPRKFFAEFSVDMLLRGDMKSRFDAHKVAIEHGIRNPNEVRELENMNPRADGFGDAYWMPMNFTTAGSAAAQPAAEPQQQAMLVMVQPQQLSANDGKQQISEKATAIVQAAAERLVNKEISAIKKWGPRYEDKDSSLWQKWLEDWYGKHVAALQKSLGLDDEEANSYIQAQQKEILEKGLDAVQSWLPGKVNHLVQVALGEEGREK